MNDFAVAVVAARRFIAQFGVGVEVVPFEGSYAIRPPKDWEGLVVAFDNVPVLIW